MSWCAMVFVGAQHTDKRGRRFPVERFFSYGLAKASRVASRLYKTLLGESRRPVRLSGVEVPGSKRLNSAFEPYQRITNGFRGRCYA